MTSLWIDRHRPARLAHLSLHHSVTEKLVSLANSDEMPHLLFYGPPGSGKKTRVMALLREIYGAGVEKVKVEHRSIKTTSGKTIEISTVGSNYHVECNPSDVGNNDRFVVQDVIKEMASSGSIHTVAAGSKPFKILLLSEVDRLSKQAQAALRRTMEKYSAQCRIILLCNSSSKIIEPVRSRCLGIRIPAPNHDEIAGLLVQVCRKEGVQCPPEFAIKISSQCDRNLRRALLMMEAARSQVYPSLQLSVEQLVVVPDWELFICTLAREILSEQSPAKLLQARDMLYDLLTNCIPADVILAVLSREMLKALDDGLKHEVMYWVAYYEHRLAQGSKEIFHLEAFVARFMALYKKWLMDFFG